MRTFFTSVTACALFFGSAPVSGQVEENTDPAGCVVMLRNGRKLSVERFWRINEQSVEYEASGNLHDLNRDDINWIRCDGRQFVIAGDSLEPWTPEVVTRPLGSVDEGGQSTDLSLATEAPGSGFTTKELFLLGQEDARKYHGGTTRGILTGLIASPAIIAAPIIAAIPPFVNRDNPNLDVYLKEREYRRGYRSVAHPKKAGTVLLGMAIGMIAIGVVTHAR